MNVNGTEQKMAGSKFDGMQVKKFELGLQERVDTGLMPSFYSFMSIYASTVATLEGDTDPRPKLLSWIGMGYVRQKKDQLMVDQEKKIEERIKETRDNNGGSVTNAEKGKIEIQEAVKSMANIVGLFDEKYEKKQTIGLLVSPKDMEEMDVPPIITDLNACEDELRELGVEIEESKGTVAEGKDYQEDEEE